MGGLLSKFYFSRPGEIWMRAVRAVNDLPNTPELDDLVREIESKGRRSLAVPADVSLEENVEKIIQQVVQKLGSLDVVSPSSDG